jgi:uncharacterized protein (TIGR02722 family)
MKKLLIVLCAITFVFLSCSTGTKVKRVDSDRQIDLSGYWNDVDVRIVCDSLINDCLRNPRVEQGIRAKGRTPVVIVGRFRNESSEHINTAIISSTMETTIFNTGRLDFVAGGSVRDELRAEREDQQNHASPETMARIRNETGADYMLTGAVRTIIDRDGNQTVRTYFVTAELTDIETNQRIWMGQNTEIKKLVTQSRNRP